MRESIFHKELCLQAQPRKACHILDLGCGTGDLMVYIKKSYPDIKVFGLDGDAKVLEIAKTKAQKAKLEITLDLGMAYKLPYPNDSFDRVFSSLLFHHLTLENKKLTIKEIIRVLKVGGELHVADWGKAQNIVMRIAFLAVQLLDGFKTTKHNVNGLLPELFTAGGLEEVREMDRYKTIFGTFSFYKALKSKKEVQ
ncbi:MAG TPA: class I SAM-dependent methyltransferase [Spirochaetes bacterium]|nr:class I SAM-dependent methyltransferase [Spirochaetota bacterium]